MIPSALNIAPFADYIETIKMLYRVDEDFKILCDDYAISKTNIEKLKESTFRDSAIELDYKQLSLDLEKEIIDYVNGLR